MWRANRVAIGLGAVLVVGVLVANYYDEEEIYKAQQVYLRLYGESLYEYHALTGKWPSRIEDLAGTSLALKYPHWWKSQLDIEADVIVWPKDLKPDPKQNGHALLCYHNKGLDAERGRMWVCWGDLQTGCITSEELRGFLGKQKIL